MADYNSDLRKALQQGDPLQRVKHIHRWTVTGSDVRQLPYAKEHENFQLTTAGSTIRLASQITLDTVIRLTWQPESIDDFKTSEELGKTCVIVGNSPSDVIMAASYDSANNKYGLAIGFCRVNHTWYDFTTEEAALQPHTVVIDRTGVTIDGTFHKWVIKPTRQPTRDYELCIGTPSVDEYRSSKGFYGYLEISDASIGFTRNYYAVTTKTSPSSAALFDLATRSTTVYPFITVGAESHTHDYLFPVKTKVSDHVCHEIHLDDDNVWPHPNRRPRFRYTDDVIFQEDKPYWKYIWGGQGEYGGYMLIDDATPGDAIADYIHQPTGQHVNVFEWVGPTDPVGLVVTQWLSCDMALGTKDIYAQLNWDSPVLGDGGRKETPLVTDSAHYVIEKWRTGNNSVTDTFTGHKYCPSISEQDNRPRAMGYFSRVYLRNGDHLEIKGSYKAWLSLSVDGVQVYFRTFLDDNCYHNALDYTATKTGFHYIALFVGTVEFEGFTYTGAGCPEGKSPVRVYINGVEYMYGNYGLALKGQTPRFYLPLSYDMDPVPGLAAVQWVGKTFNCQRESDYKNLTLGQATDRTQLPVKTNSAYMLEYFDTTHVYHEDEYSHVSYDQYTAEGAGIHAIMGYFARVKLNEGETIQLSGNYDDTLYVRINSEKAGFSNPGSNPWNHQWTWVVPATGLYNIDIFVGNRGGDAGAVNNNPIRLGIKAPGETTFTKYRYGNLDFGDQPRFFLPTEFIDLGYKY